MEAFRKGECSRFQASLHVTVELGKWAGASEKEKGKAFDTYLAEINSFVAVQDEDQSAIRGTSPPVGAAIGTGQQSSRKRSSNCRKTGRLRMINDKPQWWVNTRI